MEVLGFVSIPDWLLILLGILIAVYLNYLRKYSYWASQGVKHVRPLPIFGNAYENFYKQAPEIELERYKKLGRVYGIYEGSSKVLIVGEPELVKQILVKDFHIFQGRGNAAINDPLFTSGLGLIKGERWKALRTVVSQAFSSGKMRKMSPLIKECTQSLIENLDEIAEKQEPLDCKKILSAFTMDVIASCAFGIRVDSHKDPQNPFVQNASRMFTQRLSPKFLVLAFAPKLFKMLDLRILEKDIEDFFCSISHRLIQERNEKKVQERADLLQLLLNASELSKSKDDSTEAEDELEDPLAKTYEVAHIKLDDSIKLEVKEFKRRALTEIEVLAHCLMFFTAGYENTASMLTYCLYQAAVAPEIQEKLVKEIEEMYKEYGDITYDTLPKMPYLDAFVSEILRLNNPGLRLERVAEEDYELGNTGIVIPKGATVGIPVYAMQHDPEWFPNPNKFDPERFMPGNRENIVPYTYLPFGGGPRSCLALRFALVEVKLCLSRVLHHYRFSTCTQTNLSFRFLPAVKLIQPIGVILNVEKRS